MNKVMHAFSTASRGKSNVHDPPINFINLTSQGSLARSRPKPTPQLLETRGLVGVALRLPLGTCSVLRPGEGPR